MNGKQPHRYPYGEFRQIRLAIKGTPTFLVRGTVQGVPNMGISWLVLKGVLAIVSNKKTKSKVDK